MNKVKKIVYKKLGRKQAWGEAYAEDGIIYIDSRCKGIKELEIIIHEASHIVQPYLAEEAIQEIGVELTRILWETGFRKVDNDTSQPLQGEATHTPKPGE